MTARRLEQNTLPLATRNVILEANQLDIELYQYATMLYKEQIRQHGPSFASRAKRFQSVNRWISPLLRGYWQVRKVSVRVFVRKWINYLRYRVDSSTGK